MTEIGRVPGYPDPRIAQYQPKAADAKPVEQGQNKKSLPPYQLRMCQKPNLDNLEHWSDLRGFNLSRYKLFEQFQKLDLSKSYDVLITCSFDSKTPWPPKEKLPPNFDPKKIMEIRKNPGLGIRDLHKQGITGKGVRVAIIDQAFASNGDIKYQHEEFRGKVAQYAEIDTLHIEDIDKKQGSMHGSAVTSLFVGKECGVAPGAEVHYWGLGVGSYEIYRNNIVNALKEIIKYNNKQKNNKDKVRVVNISACILKEDKCFNLWQETIKEAKQNGIIVITADSGFQGIGCCSGKDRNDPNNYEICYFAREDNLQSGHIYVPVDNRTFASSDEKSYTSQGDAGFSWGAPYLAGVMTLGFQIDPDLKEDDIWKYLKETGTPFNRGWIINPEGFVDRVKLELKNKTNKTK